jgi:hypothetical protein
MASRHSSASDTATDQLADRDFARGDHAVERGRYGGVAEIDLRVLSVGGVDMVSMKNVLRLK